MPFSAADEGINIEADPPHAERRACRLTICGGRGDRPRVYSAYFRLKEPPFSLSPDPRFLFMSERHREGLAHLIYGIRQPGGFVLLTGEIGSGKTTLSRSLVKQLPAETDVALILNPRLTVLELLASICDELRVPSTAEAKSVKVMVDALNRRLLETFAQGRRTVLIIDEAQNLQTDVLEQIRLLTNLETSQEKLLQIILIGQPELLQVLRQKRLLQLAQRITAQYHLLPLSRSETFGYIRHRLSVAGRSDPIFTTAAMFHVYRLSGGVPRLINIICDRAMLGAYSLDRRRVSAGIVCRAHKETRGFIPWRRRVHAVRAAGYAGLALLMIGGGLYIGTGSLYFHRRDAAATEGAVPAAQSPGPVPSDSGGPQKSPGLEAVHDPPVSGGGDTSIQHSREAAAGVPAPNPRLAAILADPALRGTNASCFANLYSRLGLKIPADRSNLGCGGAAEQGFTCMNRVGNWTKLRYYDLPAILEVNLPTGARHRVTLVRLDDTTATLAIGDREYTFPLQEVDSAWDGSFILVWKLPFPSRRITLGTRGEDVLWIRHALETLEGGAPGTAGSNLYDEGLRKLVMAFQLSRSLPQDGMVGNATLVRLTLAVMGPDAPSISRHAP